MNVAGHLALPVCNRLLVALPPELRGRLLPRTEEVRLALRETLHDADARLEYVWFPLTAVVSLLLDVKSGASYEAATIGSEGLVGFGVFLAAQKGPVRAVCQVPGRALRMPVEHFKRALVEHVELDDVVRRYLQGLLAQVFRANACKYFHGLRQRLCTWLLLTQDRVGDDEFALTHDALALSLAVPRPSVTIAAGELRRARLIDYRRARIRVLDRQGLAAEACECYERLRAADDCMCHTA